MVFGLLKPFLKKNWSQKLNRKNISHGPLKSWTFLHCIAILKGGLPNKPLEGI
jgi:hypothetical protein